MINSRSIIAHIERLSGHPLNHDEGVHHGDPERPVQRVLVTWMATADALRYAGEHGDDLVICHESAFYPYDVVILEDAPEDWQSWPTNRQRLDLLTQHDLVLMRAHGSVDDICIFDDFAAVLGLGEPTEYSEDLAKVYDIEPCTLSELVQRVKVATGMDAVRLSAPRGLDQVVRRVGLPWGGLGLFVNVRYQQRLIALGCDVMIAGESDNYGFRFGAELGIPMIETGHEISENPGLEHFARMLQEHFTELRVTFYTCEPAWQCG